MIDFTKHNKGLRLLAALFNDITIFETETFQDIYTSVDFIPESEDRVYLLYSNPLYDEYIINNLTNHKEFIETKLVEIDNKWFTLYIFSVVKEKQLYYNYIKAIGSSGVNRVEMLDVFVLWKEYLNNSFYECYNIWSVKQCLVTKKGTD